MLSVIQMMISEQNGEAASQQETDPLLRPPAVVIDVNEDLEDFVLNSLNTKLEDDKGEPGRIEPWTIYRVPDTTRNDNPGSYEPRVVSIGPFHHGKAHLLPMERIKRQFLSELISHDPSNRLEKYIKKVSARPFLEKINECYSEPVIGSDGGKALVEMMVLDGCFIIEFFLKTYHRSFGELVWSRAGVDTDLLLIENQIPFFVLQALYDSTSVPSLPPRYPGGSSITCEPITLRKLLLHCISTKKDMDYRVTPSTAPIPKTIHHLLHLLYSSLRPSTTEFSMMCSFGEGPSFIRFKRMLWRIFIHIVSWFVIVCTCRNLTGNEDGLLGRSATELDKGGIDFERRPDGSRNLDVTYRVYDAVMEIQLLSINDGTFHKFRNLMSFEQGLPGTERFFTSYVAFMNELIATPADVALLWRCGILKSNLSADDTVSFLSGLSKGTDLDPDRHPLGRLLQMATSYGAKKHRKRARMVRDYFNNPWSAISLVAAIILLALTLLQCVYAILSYIHS